MAFSIPAAVLSIVAHVVLSTTARDVTAFLSPISTTHLKHRHSSRFTQHGRIIGQDKNKPCVLRTGPLEVCRTPSVERVGDKTQRARDVLNELESRVKGDANTYFDGEFKSRMKSYLAAAGIADGRYLNSSIDTKVEYTTEFSIDAITNVIAKGIDAFGAASDESGEVTAKTAATPAALESYKDLVLSIGEAVKVNGDAAGSYSFSFNRLGPGMFAFVSASSTSITDKETFGTESIAATTFCYQMVESIDDIKATTGFMVAKIQAAALLEAKNKDYEVLKQFSALQVELVTQLGVGNIIFAEYVQLDSNYQGVIERAQRRLDDEHFGAQYPQRILTTEANPSATSPDRNYKSINSALKHERRIMDKERLELIRFYKKENDCVRNPQLEKSLAKAECKLVKYLSRKDGNGGDMSFPLFAHRKKIMPGSTTSNSEKKRDELGEALERKAVTKAQIEADYSDSNYL